MIQFCAECKGEVNVEMHNGATLRCGCGKTTQAAPKAPAQTPPLISMLETMVKYKALRLRTGDLEIELHPEAFAQPWAAQTSSLGVDDKPCPCGHSVPVQHNVNGECLEGCDSEACAEKAAA